MVVRDAMYTSEYKVREFRTKRCFQLYAFFISFGWRRTSHSIAEMKFLSTPQLCFPRRHVICIIRLVHESSDEFPQTSEMRAKVVMML